MSSFYVHYFKGTMPEYSHSLRYQGFGLHHVNSGWAQISPSQGDEEVRTSGPDQHGFRSQLKPCDLREPHSGLSCVRCGGGCRGLCVPHTEPPSGTEQRVEKRSHCATANAQCRREIMTLLSTADPARASSSSAVFPVTGEPSQNVCPADSGWSGQ